MRCRDFKRIVYEPNEKKNVKFCDKQWMTPVVVGNIVPIRSKFMQIVIGNVFFFFLIYEYFIKTFKLNNLWKWCAWRWRIYRYVLSYNAGRPGLCGTSEWFEERLLNFWILKLRSKIWTMEWWNSNETNIKANAFYMNIDC